MDSTRLIRNALRQWLAEASSRLERGDREGALEAVASALKIDPDFAPAQALADRIRAHTTDARPPGKPAPPVARPATRRPSAGVDPRMARPGSWSAFEARVRRRRAGRCVDSARSALAAGAFDEAARALEEAMALDPSTPDLSALVDRVIKPTTKADVERAPVPAERRPAAAERRPTGKRSAPRKRTPVPAPMPAPACTPAPARMPVPARTDDAGERLLVRARVPVAPVRPRAARSGARRVLGLAACFTAIFWAASSFIPSSLPPDPPPRIAEGPAIPLVPAPAPPVQAPVEPPPPAESFPAESPAVSAAAANAGTGASAAEPERTRPEVPAEPPPTPAATRRTEDGAGRTGDGEDVAVAAAEPEPVVSAPPQPPAPAAAPAVAEREAAPQPEDPVPVAQAAYVPPASTRTAAPPPSAAPRPEGPDPEQAIQTALQRYRSAYGGLNAAAAKAVWPSVDETALAGAFRNLREQEIRFEWCDVQVSGSEAVASCGGSATYVPRIGARDPHVETRLWTFNLRQDTDGWLIRQVDVRRGP